MIEKGMGWLKDYPDFRDYTPQHPEIRPMLERVGVAEPEQVSLPASVYLMRYFPPIQDQGQLGSSTAQACVGTVAYFERRAFGTYTDFSELFLYKVTRNLMRVTGDTGAYLRTTLDALARIGVPPEEYWAYNVTKVDDEPPPFCYALAQNFQSLHQGLKYYRLDLPYISKEVLLKSVKAHLGAGLPSMFGFTIYRSISQAGETGEIPFPTRADHVEGAHAVIAVGYDDNKKIRNTNPGEPETTGALLFRNSWGTNWGWGEGGYGWLPYKYVLQGLAQDWWSLAHNEWLATAPFAVDYQPLPGGPPIVRPPQ